MPAFDSLAIDRPEKLLFGRAPKPLVTRKGMIIGGGTVYPELNFTLPPMFVNAETMPAVLEHYREIAAGATKRAVELEAPGLVIEFETLPPMTENPQWAIDCTKILVDALEDAYAKHGLKSVLRITPNDTREMERPPRMRDGKLYEDMLRTFEGCAAAGAELLSIESVGGKELHDEALMMGDLAGVIFSLCILGVRDMNFLWGRIQGVAERHAVYAAGDTACGFGNTAMVLAEQKMIPRTFAAVVRAVTAVRTLAGYEQGAVGPGKDCGYENPFLKAITGLPMAMEGKTAACAHMSPVGNIAAATCDTWSNESVQNIKLLGGMAPTCYLEQLIYDCRMMNMAIADGFEAQRMMQRWMVRSDAGLDPQAYILSPESVIAVAGAIVAAATPYQAGIAAARAAIGLLQAADAEQRVRISAQERPWLASMQETLEGLPAEEEAFIAQQVGLADGSKIRWKDYEIG